MNKKTKNLRNSPMEDLIFTLISYNQYDYNKNKNLIPFCEGGYWSASAIVKHGLFKLGRTNVPKYMNSLIKNGLVEKSEILYTDKYHKKRKNHKTMYQLKQDGRTHKLILDFIWNHDFNKIGEYYFKKISPLQLIKFAEIEVWRTKEHYKSAKNYLNKLKKFKKRSKV